MISSLVTEAVAMLPSSKTLNDGEFLLWQRLNDPTFSSFHSERKKLNFVFMTLHSVFHLFHDVVNPMEYFG